MKIILLTPGTGSYYCGVCMRDNALAKELIRQGHEAIILPMYLPLTLEESSASPDTPIFFGGINVYLQQKLAIFRHTPRWLDQLLNQRWLLKRVAGSAAGQTGGPEIGELTHSMLLGEAGKQSKELHELIAWMKDHGKPHAVWISTALLVGLARQIQRELGVPVLCSLQGEDVFLNSLSEPWKTRCWQTLDERSPAISAFIAPSQSYANTLAQHLHFVPNQLRVIPNGIGLEHFTPAPTPPPLAIGFLARMHPSKGLDLVVDAFILLQKRGAFPAAKLLIAGSMIPSDAPFVDTLKAKLHVANALAHVEFFPNLDLEEKSLFLRRCTLLSVPANYGESFGLYLAEAWASGVPVVQPKIGSFPELIAQTGAGLIFEPRTADALADAWEILLANPQTASALGAKGRQAAEQIYNTPTMAQSFLALTREFIDAPPAVPLIFPAHGSRI